MPDEPLCLFQEIEDFVEPGLLIFSISFV